MCLYFIRILFRLLFVNFCIRCHSSYVFTHTWNIRVEIWFFSLFLLILLFRKTRIQMMIKLKINTEKTWKIKSQTCTANEGDKSTPYIHILPIYSSQAGLSLYLLLSHSLRQWPKLSKFGNCFLLLSKTLFFNGNGWTTEIFFVRKCNSNGY